MMNEKYFKAPFLNDTKIKATISPKKITDSTCAACIVSCYSYSFCHISMLSVGEAIGDGLTRAGCGD